MTCDLERVEALFDGTLPEEERAEAEKHLQECPACRTWYAALQELHRPEKAPEDLLERVMFQVEARPRKKRPRTWIRTAAGMAACAVLVLLLGLSPLREMIAPGEGGQAREADPAAYGLEESAPETEVDRWLENIDGGALTEQGRWHMAGELHDLPLSSSETDAVRLWLENAGRTPDSEGESGDAWSLTQEEAAALNEAVPSLGLPTDQEVQLYLPAA